MCECYNREHGCRRGPRFARTDLPGSDAAGGVVSRRGVVVVGDGEMLGYAVCSAARFGVSRRRRLWRYALRPGDAFGLIGHVIQRAAASTTSR